MKPITRKEYYLAKAAGTYTGPTPPPVLREDYYLATLAGDYSGNCPAPVTRIEKYMSAAAGITSYVPQPVTRIEKYWYAIANGMGYVPEPVTREEHFLYEIITAGPKYIDKIAEGSLILLTDSAQAPFNALTVYGHSTQSGTPSPENPVPIVSAGSVMTTGAQLFDASLINGVQNNGISVTHNANGSIKVTGIIEQTGGTNLYSQKFHLNEGEYSIGLSIGVDFYVSIVPYNSTISALDCNIGNTSAHGFIEDGDYTLRFYRETESNENINFEVYVMINSGSTALPWEPYTGGVPGVNPYAGEINISVSDGGTQSQTLTLSTPGGLPGIPVTSGGNYTDESGQQWVCDEIDLKRGKHVQRVIELDFDGAETWSTWGANNITEGITGFYSDVPSGFQKMLTDGALSNLLQYIPNAWGGGAHGINISTPNANQYIICSIYNEYLDDISTDDAAIESWKNILNTNNLHVMLILQDPIETDLPAEEIDAYKALHTYSPTTTVSNDADAWMKVGYKATP